METVYHSGQGFSTVMGLIEKSVLTNQNAYDRIYRLFGEIPKWS